MDGFFTPRLNDLTTKFTKVIGEKHELSEQIQTLSDRLEKSAEAYMKLTKENKEVKEEYNRAMQNLSDKITTLIHQNEELTKQNEEYVQRNNNLHETLKTMNENLSLISQIKDNCIDLYEDTKKRLKDEEKTTEQIIDAISQSISIIQNIFNKDVKHITIGLPLKIVEELDGELQSLYHKIQNRNETMENKIQQLENDNKVYKKELEELEDIREMWAQATKDAQKFLAENEIYS